jgi:hypothetical protein
VKTNKRFLKKKILKIKYLEQEYNDSLEIYLYAKKEFEIVVRELHYNLNLSQDIFSNKNASKPSDGSATSNQVSSEEHCDSDLTSFQKENTKQPAWVKKVFRKIVRITHPDKLPAGLGIEIRENLVSSYQNATEAVDRSDYIKLIVVADDLKLDLSNIKIENSEIFSEREARFKKKIDEIQKSVFWVWANSPSEKKDAIVQEFLKSQGWTSSATIRNRDRPPGQHPGKNISWARKLSLKNGDEK